jgi:CRP-like cAMP-binding protein
MAEGLTLALDREKARAMQKGSEVNTSSNRLLGFLSTENRDVPPLTHEFLAIMLGVQRPGATIAMNELEEQGFMKESGVSYHS